MTTYPFVPKTNAQLVAGQSWSIPLSDGRFACGRVLHNGSAWVDVPGQVKSPGTPTANYNHITFSPVTARLVRVLATRTGTYGIGIKEFQIFNMP
jgi:hypothetical protein